MRSERACELVRLDLSARMDGEVDTVRSRELDSHLEGCADCRRYETSLRQVKRAVRLQPAPEVPDLAPRILAAIARDARPLQPPVWRTRLRIALVAAAVGALVMGGAVLPFRDRPADTATADIAQEIHAAARELTGYHARYEITERGWHPDVGTRRFDAEVWFAAPESLRLQVRDRTDYPDARWPVNDVDLVADQTNWWISEPSSCPPAALPGCAIRPGVEERSLVNRQPFDGTSALPTDIILPLETIGSSERITVVGREEVAGRDAQHVVLSYWQAVPLVRSLQPGGSWVPFAPLDTVDLWLDEETWFPLRLMVTGPGRSRSLEVVATSFEQPDRFSPETFEARSSGIVRDGGFAARGKGRAAVVPRYRSGLRAYRAGVTSDGQSVTTYARGMSWLKVATDDARRPSFTAASAEIVRVGRGFGLYQPANESLRRRIDIFARDVHVHLESNLARQELIRVAASLDARGLKFERIREGAGSVVTRIGFREAGSLPFAQAPSYLPEGYEPSSALLSRSPRGSRLTMFYRRSEAEFEGFGIRLTQARGFTSLPPSSEDLVGVSIGDLRARWSAERSELEWVEDGVYRALAVPAFDLETAARIAASLR